MKVGGQDYWLFQIFILPLSLFCRIDSLRKITGLMHANYDTIQEGNLIKCFIRLLLGYRGCS